MSPHTISQYDVIDTIPTNIGFTQCQKMTAQSQKSFEAWGLTRLLTLKLECKVMLTLTHKIDLLIAKLELSKYFEIANHAASITFIKCDNLEAYRKLIGTNKLVSQNNWIPVKRNYIHIFVRNSSKQRCFRWQDWAQIFVLLVKLCW